MSGTDIIGDVHAQGTRLAELLKKLGYGGPEWKHPDGRKALFMGDLIDRGKEHGAVFDIVRAMDATVLMGNHEFNAICYSKKGVRGGYIRRHTLANNAQHADFLEEFPIGSEGHKEAIAWFKTFPLYQEKKDLRLVHACWHQNSLRVCKPYLHKDGSLKENAYRVYDTENPPRLYRAIDVLIKGPDFALPREAYYPDAHGHTRRRARLYWWKEGQNDAEGDFFQNSQSLAPLISSSGLAAVSKLRNKFKYAAEIPVIFGHYNIDVEPNLAFAHAACVNFKGRIVAYRWNKGDTALQPDRLVYV